MTNTAQNNVSMENAKILIVDDEEMVCSFISDVLDSNGYQYALAKNGLEALDTLAKEYFPIIITDINMPKMGGMQLLEQTKQNFPDSVVIIMTGFSEKYPFTEVIKAGASDYLVKPFSPNELLAKVNRVMRETILVQKLTKEIADRQHAEIALKNAQVQMLQNENLASMGQLAAGVAHEINNPVGFIASNLRTLEKYVGKFSDFITIQTEVLQSLNAEKQVQEDRKKLKINYIIDDSKDLLEESLQGAVRISEIVQNLKSFSRLDEADLKEADINECLESTIKVVWHELKDKAIITKEYGDLPSTKCYPQQLNLAFINFLINAVRAIETQGQITIKTWFDGSNIFISISDTGHGIHANDINKIFDPFYTTRAVGEGTGLGLSVAHGIIQKHNGHITVDSSVDNGTIFSISLPVV